MVTRDIVQRLLNVINDTRRRVNTLESREYVLLNATQTLTNKTLTTPSINNFTNAQHSHANAAGGGQLSLTNAVSGVLPAANGGTGVNNATRTLTISTNSGTLAFSGAGFTLTVPATGTAALLGTANVFTAAQTVDVDSNAFATQMMLRNDDTGASAVVALDIRNSDGPFQLGRLGPSTTAWSGYGAASEAFFYAGQATNGLNFIAAKSTAVMRFFAGDPATSTPELSLVASAVRINTTTTKAALSIDQPSAAGAIPTLYLRQADLSEEFIRFDTTVGAGNAINTTALGTYYGRVRVWVEGVGERWLALYNT